MKERVWKVMMGKAQRIFLILSGSYPFSSQDIANFVSPSSPYKNEGG